MDEEQAAEAARLKTELEAHKAELDTHKQKLAEATAHRDSLAKDLDQHKEDLALMRDSLRAMNKAVAVAEAAPGLTPEQLKMLLSPARVAAVSQEPSTQESAAAPAYAGTVTTMPSVAVTTAEEPRPVSANTFGSERESSAWSGKNMTPLKAKMMARRWGSKAISPADGDAGATMSPLKKKLMERRKAKLAGRSSTPDPHPLSNEQSNEQSEDPPALETKSVPS